MRKEIELFCEKIKEDFCLYLYKKDCAFPFCCKLSADIITSFLTMAFGGNFHYICTTCKGVHNHAWTLYESSEEKFIISFTELQYIDTKMSEKIRNKKIDDKTFKDIIKNINVVFDEEEGYIWKLYYIMQPKEQECIGLVQETNVKLDKECFMDYLDRVYDNVYENTDYY